MPLPELDLDRLQRLRDRFLRAGAKPGRVADYWAEPEDLEHYDAVFAQRIGWKWDAVLAELEARAALPARLGTVVDWGCGTGIAGRRVAGWPGVEVERVLVHDRSTAAIEFALAQHEADGQAAAPGAEHKDADIDLLLLSHVLDELDAKSLDHVRVLAARSRRLLWVEAGTRAVSHRLGQLRDELLERFTVVAPCTHQHACPVFGEEADDGEAPTSWCHFFAAPPVEVFQDADWVKLARSMGIDLRALPYALLALTTVDGEGAAAPAARVIGRPQVGNKLAHYWTCDGATGLQRHQVVKTRDRERYRTLKKGAVRWLDPPG